MSRGRRKIALSIIAAVVLLAGAVVILSRQRTHGGEGHVAAIFAPALAAELAGVELREPVRMRRCPLTENYEHVKEHVPPYGPDGEMQDRERFATAPLDPFAIADNSLGNSPTDAALKSRINQLKNQFMSGGPAPLDDQPSLEALCNASSLDPMALLRAARGFQWLGPMPWADAFDRAAITKATSSYGSGHAGDPELLRLIHELDATRLLWDLRDADALEKRFKLAEMLNPPQSVPTRHARVLRAIVLRDLHRNGEGAEELKQAWADALVMKDLTPPDTAELQWLSAIVFFAASQFGQAEPYCQKVWEGGGEHAHRAAVLDAFCLDELGDTAKAQEVRKRFQLGEPPTTTAASGQEGHNLQNRSKGLSP